MIYKFEFNSKEEKYEIEKNNSDKYLIEEQYLIEGNFLVYTDELSEIEIIKIKQNQQNENILINMLAITEMYELNSLERTIKEVPAHIQATYQKLYELELKEISEMPFEVRINLKAK